ncbi:hypothetical protein SAMN05444484_101609 [Flavobacterium chilense]|uniref:Uncharacterized protein n=1 Tax=Flavobacterium chilense TaxID=946677 RepID=A0A1M6YJA9_9FLAO|nr:hypothetical protein SAMN05444484_101609 [Flavobacterium chilense]
MIGFYFFLTEINKYLFISPYNMPVEKEGKHNVIIMGSNDCVEK